MKKKTKVVNSDNDNNDQCDALNKLICLILSNTLLWNDDNLIKQKKKKKKSFMVHITCKIDNLIDLSASK